MRSLLRIRLFRIALRATYPFALILVYPFSLLKPKNPSGLFFFFDHWGIGGAQRVFLDILESVRDTHKQVYFTRSPPGTGMRESFRAMANTDILDIHPRSENPLARIVNAHYYAFYINRHRKPRVFGSNSTFFYDMLPLVTGRAYRMELLHNFRNDRHKAFEYFGLADCRYLDVRLVVDDFTRTNIERQYAEHGIPPSYAERIVMIEPAVEIPPPPAKDFSPPLRVLYAGRGGPQKRLWLMSRIVEGCLERRMDVEFHFAGPVAGELSEKTRSASIVHGEIGDSAAMHALYRKCHAVLLTSAWEGFPMIVKEGMAHGCVPIVTALPGNRMHLSDSINALLIDAVEDEAEVVRQGIRRIEELAADPALLERLSRSAYAYAAGHFSRREFLDRYRGLLLTSRLARTDPAHRAQ